MTTTEEDPVCGDGVVDGDEECDYGPDNDNSGACLTTCKLATCHDSFVYEGVEECDDGNKVDIDACVLDCKKAACGDGLLWEGSEECDDGNLEIGDGCDSTCARELLVFVSSQEYPGNLSPGINNYTGLDLGDAHCQQLADSASLPGTFRAWLSNDSSGPAARFGLMDFTGHFTLTDGTVIAKGWNDLIDGQLSAPISHDENGTKQGGVYVWSATTSSGSPSGGTCSGWMTSSNGYSAVCGVASLVNDEWTYASSRNCDNGAHLYCFQVSLD